MLTLTRYRWARDRQLWPVDFGVMTSGDWSHIPATYDAVAGDYAALFSDELDRKPFDRELLDELALEVSRVAGQGLVCDLGCGPGHIGAYLASRGCDVVGVDISPAMLDNARERHPNLTFELGDMRALPFADDACIAIACFYALIHLRRAEVPAALAEMRRVLRPGGQLVLAVHGGEGETHVDNWFERGVSVDLTLFGAAELVQLVTDAGFADCHATVRDPYEGEHQTPRLYLRATRRR
jgi:SAM-dependent methyltransferase